ncbi:2-dehydropantoate 2-reductase [Vibrio algivorus]|uniref:2-dehydropantoate 2-reductase n=1 Tax=Vibrio algivorus TaxID=1667024 RepID=A0A557PH54_9VIBR|nr:2-dehydropantoate 2-reductase [Vibrio algivorus]TVO39986.1 2-dehydropantoate 2-reductase [Vibrio algivorus]GLT14844.1 2-dehydropantoate 2-reductase [Vibrio algivorus]
MKIGIVGIGALGSLWATKLQQDGHDVLAITRDHSQRSISISLDQQAKFEIPANDLTQLSTCQAIIITVKSTQVKQAIEPLFTYLPTKIPLIFLHNGMGALDQLSEQWNQHPLFLATTTQAAFKPNSQQVKHTGIGQTFIGAYRETEKLTAQLDSIIQELDSALPKVMWHNHIQSALWKKLAINCVINPMTAIYQCKNGELLQSQYQTEVKSLINECHQVMQAVGQNQSLNDLSDRIKQVMIATSDNFSSMHQDIHHKRPTEIEFITGFLLKQAQRYAIDMPNHQRLFKKIKQLEK